MDTLRFAQQLREYHHGALWEEEKHFLWLNSILLAAQAAVFNAALNGDGLIGPELKPRDVVLIVLGGLGLVLSIIALRVVRREGSFLPEPTSSSSSSTILSFLAMTIGSTSPRDSRTSASASCHGSSSHRIFRFVTRSSLCC